MPRVLGHMCDEFLNAAAFADTQVGWEPRADVHETNDAYKVAFDLPGIEKEDVKVTFEENTLTVSGERKSETRSEDSNYHRVERVQGSFCRTLRLPKNVDAQKIAANYKNGVLEITLPKAEEVKPKEIEININ